MDLLATIMLVLMFSGIESGVAQEDEFRDVSSCVCPGCELVVECTLTSGGATVWQGTIFDGCQDEKITLRHSQFNTSEGVQLSQSCGSGGKIVGRSVSVTGGSFTSQLTVTVSEALRGKTIKCANESGQPIGSKQIDIPSAFQTSTNIDVVLPEIIPGELTITWDLVSYDTLNVTRVHNVTTANCGKCPTTIASNFTVCNLTTSNVQVDINCSVTVIIQIRECDIIINATDEIDLKGIDLVTRNMLTTTDLITEWIHVANKNWSAVTVYLSLASTGILLMLLVLIVVITIMKCKSQHKTYRDQIIEEPTEHSDNPVGSDIMMDLGLGQYSLLHHPSDEEGMMTYLEIGPSTGDKTELIPSADRVEYAEVNIQSQISVSKNDVDKCLNLDTLLIQVRCQVTPLWHEFGVAAGVPMDTLNKCLNYTPEESIVEVLDYWLRQSKRTWGDVACILNEISLHELAEKMLKVYDTGLLPTSVVDEDIMIPATTSGVSSNSEVVSEKSQTPPPLPPKLY